jgi:glycosyltransferase involved in cell wall biosynthesis
LVSIVTAVYNGARFLEQAIASVRAQTYPNIEYTVIDGGSTDGTLEIIRQYERHLALWLSEPDRGISDAFNKGIAASQGQFIGLLNADDWLSPDQIARGVAALEDASFDFTFGDLQFHDERGEPRFLMRGDPEYARSIRSRMPELCHPTVLARRSAYERVGLFDTTLRYAMDYEWLLRLHVSGGRGRYVPGLLGHMRLGGASDTALIDALKEVRTSAMRYGQPALSAHALFGLRVVKATAGRYLEKWAPRFVYHLARGLMNRQYRARRATP